MKIPKKITFLAETFEFNEFKSEILKLPQDQQLPIISRIAMDFFKSNKSIFKRNEAASVRRDDFCQDLCDELSRRKLKQESKKLNGQLRDVKLFEKLYSTIMKSVGKTTICKSDPLTRIWACIKGVESQILEIKGRSLSRPDLMSQSMASGAALFENNDGGLENADILVGNLITSLSSTLLMLAYKDNLFDPSGKVAIAAVIEPTPIFIERAKGLQDLSIAWSVLERTEQLYRYFGGSVDKKTIQIPGKNKSSIIMLKPDKELTAWMIYDFVSNERLHQKLHQNFASLISKINTKNQNYSDLNYQIALKKGSFVSIDEIHAIVEISELYGSDVYEDTAEFGELRILEWIRGFAIIRRISEESLAGNKTGNSPISLGYVRTVLNNCGLSADKVEAFLGYATFGRGDRDLYDAPLIRVGVDDVYIIHEAFAASNITRVVFSIFSSNSFQVKKRGKAFEDNMLSFFKKNGMNAKSFKFTKDKEEYQYDIVMVWGKYIFVFELKNTTIPGGSPVPMYFYKKEQNDYIDQVTRLANGLVDNPGVFREKFNLELSDFTVIPGVISCFPFCVLTKEGEVIITDSSIVKRFFESGEISIVGSMVSEEITREIKLPIHKLWQGTSPTPEEFINAMRDPVQFREICEDLELRRSANIPCDDAVSISVPKVIRDLNKNQSKNKPYIETMSRLASTLK